MGTRCTLEECFSVYTAGLITRQEGDIQGSLELFQKAVRLNPNNATSVKQVARSLYAGGRSGGRGGGKGVAELDVRIVLWDQT